MVMVFPTPANEGYPYLVGTPVGPGNLLITAISNSYPMEVTITDSDLNTYIAGQEVVLTIPRPYGMTQADGKIGKIQSIDGTTFYLNIDSRSFDAFIVPGAGVKISRPASLSCWGSRNLQYNNSTNGVPYQNLNNEGN